MATKHKTGSANPKVYVALLTQTGTDAPVATVLENTLGEVPTFAYNGNGDYTLNAVSAIFLDGKTDVSISNVLDLGNPMAIYAGRSSDTSISINTYTLNNLLINTRIKISIYP
jgi:hypothetical protein